MDPRLGSTWRKWDLHVHTPASHTATYGTNNEAWSRFLSDLAALPTEFGVIGINDYMWVDGYERVLAAHEQGALPNIQAIFPVIELRVADFIGTTSHLARLNAHVIFSPGTDPELIRNQFIPRLVPSFTLGHPYDTLPIKWDAVPTREALSELGQKIKESVPKSKLPDFDSDLIEGFRNWVIPFRSVRQALEDSSLVETPLLGLGKTEWESIPWNNNTVATKKTLVSESDLLFTAALTPTAWKKSVGRLREAEVNDRLLDCSDAHHYSDSSEKDRVGNCFTWICADPTLAGLKHALLEFEARVFVGEKPPLLVRQQTDPTHFISRIRLAPSDPANTPAPGFDVDLPINGGFVAVIGNKGSGKSALLDSMALAANSHSEAHFTFLSDRRYRNRRNYKAPHYQVELETVDGETVGPLLLSSSVDLNVPEQVRYLPQSLLETLCNKEPGSPDDSFEQELRSIIFSHVPEYQRLDTKSLDDLLAQRGRALDRQISQHRVEIGDLNKTIAQLEDEARLSRLKSLKASLLAVNQQLEKHDSARPADPVPPPVSSEDLSPAITELEEVKSQLAALAETENKDQLAHRGLRIRSDAIMNLAREVDILRSSYDAFVAQASSLAVDAGLDLGKIAQLTINTGPLDSLREEVASQLEELNRRLAPDGSIQQTRLSLRAKTSDLEALLDEPRRRFEQEQSEVEAWKQARRQLVGSPTQEGSQQYFEAQITEVEAIPQALEDLRAERLAISQEVHSLLCEKVEMYRELYSPVQDFIETHPLAKGTFSLDFAADLEIREFSERFLSHIDRGAAGSFFGIEASIKLVEQRVKSLRPSDWGAVAQFLDEHDRDLRFDRRNPDKPVSMDSATDLLRKGIQLSDVYDYLFGMSYIDAEYELRSDGRSISELSPGQKGTILLMFYLLVDQSGRPIALDQPDENLDNHTVHTLLRPAMRSAKTNRQVIVVTHSPNLAVVGDADQVIVASCDGEEFRYESGSIENPVIRDLVVNVLEGTWPAFSDRGRKYTVAHVPAPS